MARQPDYYLVLGVAPDASPQEIARAYRSLVRRRHPDSRPEGGQQTGLADIYDAYAVLRDPVRRADYDGAARGHDRPAPQRTQPAAGRPPAGGPEPVRVRVRVRRDRPTGPEHDEPTRPGEKHEPRTGTGRPPQGPRTPTIWVGPTVTLGPRPGPRFGPDAGPDLGDLLRELRRRLL